MSTMYIKSFSKGQITIPKKLRDKYGLGDEFWLQVADTGNEIILKPVDKKTTQKDREAYKKMLLTLDTSWFGEEGYREWKQMRKQTEERLKKLGI